MTWTPISGTVPQYSTASNALAGGYYLKFYASGTTTPINMATSSTGATELAQCKLSADGYPITNPLDEDTKFIPHIDQDYRIVLYTNVTDANTNNTAAAAFNIDALSPNIAPLATATNVSIRTTDVLALDDYDRSPLFLDGDGFTAGAGPHLFTVPAGWTPTNADMRFYIVTSAGTVSTVTPTITTATTFTLAETLTSTDQVFIGDDTFRNQFDGDPADTRARLSVDQATLDARYLLESNNLSDLNSDATARTNLDVYSKAESEALVPYQTTTVSIAGVGNFSTGSVTFIKLANLVVITSNSLGYSTGSSATTGINFVPVDYRPSSGSVNTVISINTSNILEGNVTSTGAISIASFDSDTGATSNTASVSGFSISYAV